MCHKNLPTNRGSTPTASRPCASRAVVRESVDNPPVGTVDKIGLSSVFPYSRVCTNVRVRNAASARSSRRHSIRARYSPDVSPRRGALGCSTPGGCSGDRSSTPVESAPCMSRMPLGGLTLPDPGDKTDHTPHDRDYLPTSAPRARANNLSLNVGQVCSEISRILRLLQKATDKPRVDGASFCQHRRTADQPQPLCGARP